MMKIKNAFLLLICCITFFTGCLNDEEPPTANFGINDTAELLIYLESRGDYINTTLDFSLINAAEVYSMLDNIYIIDIRSTAEFSNGHIEGAVNLQSAQLLDHLNNINPYNYEKIIIVSSCGQSAAYHSTLMRIYGITNIYSLEWGMASWHTDFFNNWWNPITDPYPTGLFNNILYENNEETPLPLLTFENPGSSIEEKLEERVRLLLNEEFTEDANKQIVSDASIGLNFLLNKYDAQSEEFPGYYIACIVDEDIYFFEQTGVLANPGHPPTTILYKSLTPFSEMRSNKFLQTIPTGKTIILYGYNGHFSAAITAYLRILGYNAKSVLYGYNRMHYARMLAYDVFIPYRYDQNKIGNFPYVTE